MTKEKLLEMGCPEEVTESILECFAQQTLSHEQEISAMKLDFAVDTALTVAGARNIKAVKSLLNLADVTLDENGTSPQIAEQIAALKNSDGYLFCEPVTANSAPVMRSFQPAESADGITVDPSTMSYSQLSSYIESNPDFKLN